MLIVLLGRRRFVADEKLPWRLRGHQSFGVVHLVSIEAVIISQLEVITLVAIAIFDLVLDLGILLVVSLLLPWAQVVPELAFDLFGVGSIVL